MNEVSDYNQLQNFIPDQIWTIQVPFRFFGIQIGTRMTVVKLANGKLFIHSPVKINDEVKKQLDALGSVAYIVSPNNMHHLYLSNFMEMYPTAHVFASLGLSEKRKDIMFKYQLTGVPDEAWRDDLDQFQILGFENLRETLFYHRVSQTLIVSDLIMNLEEMRDSISRMVAKKMGIYGKPMPPMDLKLSVEQQHQVKLSFHQILNWNFDKIILAHGQIVTSNGKEVLQSVFESILED